jgi:hypothetical protein
VKEVTSPDLSSFQSKNHSTYVCFILPGVAKPQTATVSDKVKNRLEQLDDFEEVSALFLMNAYELP